MRNALRRYAVAAAMVATTALLAGWPVAAQRDTPYRFDGDEAVELRGAGQKPAQVTLLNESSRPFELRADVTLRSDDDKTLDVPIAEDEPFTLEAGDVVRLEVGRPAGWDTRTSYSGFLTVWAPNQPELPAVRRPLSLTPAGLEPAVTEWNVNAYRNFVFVRDWLTLNNENLPLKGTSCPGGVEAPEAVLSDGYHTVDVETACHANGSAAWLTVAFPRHFPAHGDYKGTLDIGGEEVTLEARYSTIALWPVLALLAGFLGSLVTHHLLTRREGSRIRERLLAVAESVEGRQREFRDAAGSEPYVRYSIVYAATAELAPLRAEAGRLIFGPPFRTYTDEWAAIRTKVDKIDADLERWPQLAKHLAALKVELATRRAAVASCMAGYVTWADAMLEGEVGDGKLTYELACELLDEAAAGAEVVKVGAKFTELSAKVNAHRNATDDPSEELQTALATCNEAAAKLARVTRARDFAEANLAELVKQLSDEVDRLGPVPATPGLRELQREVSAVTAGELSRAVEILARPGTELEQAVARRRTIDLAIFLVVAALAVWTGLQQGYLGKVWGTWADYVTLFAWAYAATTVLTPLIQALERLAEGPLRRASAPAGRDQS